MTMKNSTNTWTNFFDCDFYYIIFIFAMIITSKSIIIFQSLTQIRNNSLIDIVTSTSIFIISLLTIRIKSIKQALITMEKINIKLKQSFDVKRNRVGLETFLAGYLIPDISRISGIWIVSIYGIQLDIENDQISCKTG